MKFLSYGVIIFSAALFVLYCNNGGSPKSLINYKSDIKMGDQEELFNDQKQVISRVDSKTLDLSLGTKIVLESHKMPFQSGSDLVEKGNLKEEESFRMGDVLVLTPTEAMMMRFNEQGESKSRGVSELFFQDGDLFFNSKDGSLIFTFFKDLRAILGRTRGTSIIEHHYMVSVDYSPSEICLEEMISKGNSKRPMSYIEEGPCLNTARLSPFVNEKGNSKDSFNDFSNFSFEYGQLYSLIELQATFGSMVSVEVIRCSNESVASSHSMCPQQEVVAKDTTVALKK